MKSLWRQVKFVGVLSFGFVGLQACSPEVNNALTKPESRVFANDPQYERYEAKIRTPLRGLTVPDQFSLIDDFDAFMAWHEKYTTGRYPDDSGKIQYQRERGLTLIHCLDDAKTLVGTRSLTEGEGSYEGNSRARYKRQYSKVQGQCEDVLNQQFLHDPHFGSEQYAEILRYWSENGVLDSINRTAAKIPVSNSARTTFAYAAWSRVGFSMAHYALYHRLYGLSETEVRQVDLMFTGFVENFDYYKNFRSSGPSFQKVCNLTERATVGPNSTNDHCGSANLRIAVGAVLYGLEFNNQRVFDYGIRRLEIVLATFDKSNAYTAQIFRGMMALGYARQVIKELDKFDYAFQKAFGIDFSEMETVHGSTPTKVYLELLDFANDPQRLLEYFGRNGYGTDRRGGNLKATLAKIEKGEEDPSAVWEAFNLNDYYLYGGQMAADHYPEQFFKLLHCTAGDRVKYVNDASVSTGFNNLILRQGTGQIPTNPFDWKRSFPFCKQFRDVAFPLSRIQ